jgi:hypothetical protein
MLHRNTLFPCKRAPPQFHLAGALTSDAARAIILRCNAKQGQDNLF